MAVASPRSGEAGGGGTGTPPVVIFLHGARLTGAMWAGQIAALEDEFRCLAPDLPGHGTAADTPFTLAGAAEAVAKTIDEAGGRAVLVGLSLGGYVAMEVAARWPERVAGLVLAGATAEPVWPRSVLYLALASLFGRVPERVLRRANRWYFRARFPPAISEPLIAAGFHFRPGAVALRALVGEQFVPRLARFPGPVLLVTGQFDLLFRMSSRTFAAAAPNARRVILRRATHLTNLDQPELFSAAVRGFVREAVAPLE